MDNKMYGERLSACEEKDNYIPFGEEWEKEIMKMNKKFIVEMLKVQCLRNQNNRENLKKIEALCDNTNDTHEQIWLIAHKSLTSSTIIQ
jgi:hypothetical protein